MISTVSIPVLLILSSSSLASSQYVLTTTSSSNLSRTSFPHGFVFGTATAAYQVEGGVNEDGRGKSIWDTFSHRSGSVIDFSNGDIADDEYNRYEEDVNLMEHLHVDAYRFSISWSRIFPIARDGESIGFQSPGAAWLYVVPWGFKKLLDYIRIHYHNPMLIITENGFADLNQSPLIPLGKALQDDRRVQYHNDYLENLLLAMKDGSIVKGYFAWSLLDNWEWSSGFTARFGLYYVDYMNERKRYPKSSAHWYNQFLQN